MRGTLLSRLRCKLIDTSGETLVEVLVALLIVVGVIAMLCTTIVAAAKVNTSITPGDTVFNAAADKDSDPGEPEDAREFGTDVLTIRHDALGGTSSAAIATKTQNGYYWYEPK